MKVIFYYKKNTNTIIKDIEHIPRVGDLIHFSSKSLGKRVRLVKHVLEGDSQLVSVELE